MIFNLVRLVVNLIIICCLFDGIRAFEEQENTNEGFCTKKEDCENDLHLFATNELNGMKYLLYDVNREKSLSTKLSVYINVARTVQNLDQNWTLVLPPWATYVAGWKKEDNKSNYNNKIRWSDFFKIEILRELIAVIEFDEFIEHVSNELDLVLVLNRFNNVENANDLNDLNLNKYELIEQNCKHIQFYAKEEYIYGFFFGYKDYLKAKTINCLNVAGASDTVERVLKNELKHLNSVFVQNMDLIRHQDQKDRTYWLFRRSIQLSDEVISRANKFRRKYFDSDDEKDKTYISSDWQLNKLNKQKQSEKPVGGNYLAVNWAIERDVKVDRITDQTWNELSDENRLDAQQVAKQIFIGLKSTNLTWTYVATDDQNYKNIVKEFKILVESENKSPEKYKLFRYHNKSNKLSITEFELIEQWICAHARLFIGTANSMFSQQIQEQREILSFDSTSTFNVLCADSISLCQIDKPNRIEY